MLRKVIWLLVAMLAIGVVALMILTPTPPKGDNGILVGIPPK